MSQLKVTFADPERGTIWIRLQSDTQSVTISATYIFNTFFDLVDALYRLSQTPAFGQQQERAVWMCEPSEAEMRFTRQGNKVDLDVLWFPDGRRSAFSQPEPALSFSGNYETVCLPFWRALRHLQSRFPASEFEERWQSPFPTAELARLTQTLGK